MSITSIVISGVVISGATFVTMHQHGRAIHQASVAIDTAGGCVENFFEGLNLYDLKCHTVFLETHRLRTQTKNVVENTFKRKK